MLAFHGLNSSGDSEFSESPSPSRPPARSAARSSECPSSPPFTLPGPSPTSPAPAAAYLHAGQRVGAAVYGLLAAMHAGSLLLMINGHWVLQWLWAGGVQMAVEAVLDPFDYHRASHPWAIFLPLGPAQVPPSRCTVAARRAAPCTVR